MAKATGKARNKFQVGNTKGRQFGVGNTFAKTSPDVKKAKKFTKGVMMKTLQEVILKNKGELEVIMGEEETPIAKAIMCKILVTALEDADEKKMDHIMKWLFGPARPTVTESEKLPYIVLKRADGSTIEMGVTQKEEE